MRLFNQNKFRLIKTLARLFSRINTFAKISEFEKSKLGNMSQFMQGSNDINFASNDEGTSGGSNIKINMDLYQKFVPWDDDSIKKYFNKESASVLEKN